MELVLDLGPQPAADDFPLVTDEGEDARAPLQLLFCADCRLVQLAPTTAPPEMTPLAVESATMRAHAGVAVAELARETELGPGVSVVEVDSHHGGSWMPRLVEMGVTPCSDDEPADIVIDNHALPHEPDLDTALAARRKRLASRGKLVMEFHHLLPLVQQGQFDTVRHGHWTYLSLLALQPALERHGLAPVKALRQPSYGGSLLIVAQLRDRPATVDDSVRDVLAVELNAGIGDAGRVAELQRHAESISDQLRRRLLEARSRGRTVLGYGAPSKASVLLTFSGVTADLLPFTVDISPAKHGRRLPGCRIPIRPPDELVRAMPDEVLLLTWDIADEVISQLRCAGLSHAEYVVAIPEVKVVGGSA